MNGRWERDEGCLVWAGRGKCDQGLGDRWVKLDVVRRAETVRNVQDAAARPASRVARMVVDFIVDCGKSILLKNQRGTVELIERLRTK